MTSLSIEVGASGDRRGRAPIGLIAELDRLDEPRQSRKVAVSSRQARVVGGLAPGLWQVRLIMPNGREQVREVQISAAGVTAVRFVLGSARRRPTPAPAPPPVVRGGRGRPRVSIMLPRRYAAATGDQRSALDAQSPVVRAATVAPAKRDPVLLWKELASAAAEGSLLAAVGGIGAPAVMPEASRVDDEMRWRIGGEPVHRTYAQAGTRFHCLPVPWRTHEGTTPIALMLDQGSEARRTRVVVEDEGFGGMLAYLASGSVLSAVDLLEADDSFEDTIGRRAKDILQGKRASPLGACAAGYALIGTAVPGEEQLWHSWIENLASWFKWIPDTFILNARLKLMHARDDADAATALACLHAALGCGIPYYRRGFDWLLQAMMHFPDDPTVTEVRPVLTDMAARLDMREAFTTVTMGDTSE